jgi:type IX secretion system PorP/SprF family membrane protein
MFEGLVLNPAYAGTQVQISATLIHRDQWVNFPGAPVTQFFSSHSSFMRNRIGVGLQMTRDKIGIHEDLSIYGSFSYKIMTKTGNLSMGIQGGVNSISSDFNLLNIKDQTDILLQGVVKTLNPNFGAGIYYYNADSYIGFSVPYILNSSIVAVEGVLSEARRYRYYYLYGGTTVPVNPNIKFKPAALVRFQEGAPLSFDLNGRFVLYETVGVGVSYRWDDSLISMFELKLHESLHLGYAYEYTLSEINKFSNGTHEIMLNWRYKIPLIHKGLECPSYF